MFDYDTTSMYLYGGESLPLAFLDDLWKYDITTDTWTQMTVVGNISPTRIGSAVEALSQSATKRIVVFAGSYANFSDPLNPVIVFPGNDLWMLEEGPSMHIQAARSKRD